MNGLRPIRLGTRGSALARAQAEWTRRRLEEAGLGVETVTITTAGDERAPDTAWGEGAFVSAIETALTEGLIDVAVHSAKDVPTIAHPRLAICAWTAREDPRDALCCRERGTTLATLPPGARIGTDSPRRSAMIRSVRPDLRVHPLSGNVDTRLRKLAQGDTDAIVLAVAGLTRLGRQDQIDETLALDVFVPAPGQGALAIQCRSDDPDIAAALAALDDRATRIAVEAERIFLAATGGGCRSPIGAIGTVDGATLNLHAAAERTVDLPGHGRRRAGVARMFASGPASEHEHLAKQLAARVVTSRTRAQVLITRPTDSAAALVGTLTAHGIDATVVPTIEIRETNRAKVAEALAAHVGAWLVATSPTGVRSALAAIRQARLAPGAFRWAVIGDESARGLRDVGIDPWLPARPDGATLAATLPVKRGDVAILIRGDLADPARDATLAARGAAVAPVVAYRTVEGPNLSRAALLAALAGPIDAIVSASGSQVRGLLSLAPADARARILATPLVCIGASTAGVAEAHGFSAVTVSGGPDAPALVDAIFRALAAAWPADVEVHQPASTQVVGAGAAR